MKVFKSEISGGGQLSKLANMLNSDAADAAELINSLDSLLCVLKTKDAAAGEIFNKVSTKIETYKTILNLRKNTAESLAQAILNGSNTMNAFMENYDKIDDSQESEISRQLQNARSSLNSLLSDRSEFGFLNRLFKNSEWKSLNSNINYYQGQVTELERLHDKIRQLASTDNSVFSPVSSMQGSIASYKGSVDGVKRSSISVPEQI